MVVPLSPNCTCTVSAHIKLTLYTLHVQHLHEAQRIPIAYGILYGGLGVILQYMVSTVSYRVYRAAGRLKLFIVTRKCRTQGDRYEKCTTQPAN